MSFCSGHKLWGKSLFVPEKVLIDPLKKADLSILRKISVTSFAQTPLQITHITHHNTPASPCGFGRVAICLKRPGFFNQREVGFGVVKLDKIIH
jgi:hypothetical protein